MSSLTAWMIALTLSICVIVLTAAVNSSGLHMLASGVVSVAFALTAISEHRTLSQAGATRSEIGSSTARNAGLVWAWGALGILVTYGAILQNRWHEWPQFFVGFAMAAAASLVFSNMLNRDSEAGKVDNSVMSIGKALVALQLVCVVIAIISMFIDGKFPRPVTYPDWAACNIFFFGALAIAAISANALLADKKTTR